MSETPNHSKNTILHGIGLLLATIGTGVTAHLAEVGSWMQQHPSLTTGFAAGAGAILYGWASWTYSLHVRDSKRERISDALKKGRLICHCSEEGEIMTQHHHTGGTSIDAYACPACGNVEVVHPAGNVLIAEDTEFKPKLPATARMIWLQESEQNR